MVRIRLRRVGRKKQPSYRIVVTDQRSSRDGSYIEIIGFYNPRTRPDTMILQEDRALHWLKVGAQPTESVRRIMNQLGTWKRYERLRQGEALETLVAEAEAEAAGREPVSSRTKYPPMSKAAKEVAKAQAAVAVEDGAEEVE
jgi:small subunit ribosomal protein S16